MPTCPRPGCNGSPTLIPAYAALRRLRDVAAILRGVVGNNCFIKTAMPALGPGFGGEESQSHDCLPRMAAPLHTGPFRDLLAVPPREGATGVCVMCLLGELSDSCIGQTAIPAGRGD